MGQLQPPSPALLLLAAFSRHESALAWVRERASAQWGSIALQSPAFDFDQTDYYDATMGRGLKKVFWVYKRAFDPAELAGVKLTTNAWEKEFSALAQSGVAVGAGGGEMTEPRPLNLDPGYITAAKLVLASTKDHTHRIYLGGGIFAEITLFYRHGRWEHHEWTFPDYRRGDYHEFFSKARELAKQAQRRVG